jgi:UDPglucose 6-dehydrogenase
VGFGLMKVSVFGLWHLGTVTGVCLAGHFTVAGIDPDAARIAELAAGRPPLFEPGLEDSLRDCLSSETLSFTTDPAAASDSDVVWVTFDTPVDDNDVADFGYVEEQIVTLFPHLRDGSVLLISSQTPVGFTRRVQDRFRAAQPGKDVGFAYSPENLRLGQALEVFRRPDRIVAGVSRPQDRATLEALFAPFSQNLIWMSVESAEMTKHAINAFLATSVAFINEVAVLCEAVGADSREVERGLKSEARIGPRAYLRAGAAFAGGTLARDIRFLSEIGRRHEAPVRLLEAVGSSNDGHKRWTERKLERELAPLRGRTVAVLGLTYKPGTDTLRRSSAIELCRWLIAQGASIHAYDPMVKALPAELSGHIVMSDSAAAAVSGADAVVLGTPWPEFRAQAVTIAEAMNTGVLLDAGGFLEEPLASNGSIRYVTVGRLHPAS